MSVYTSAFSKKLKKDLKGVSYTSARRFLLKRGYSSSSARMPEYYQPRGFELMHFKPIQWSKPKEEKPLITKTLDILTPKGRLSWRSYNYLNPYIFALTVAEITQKDNWKLIVERLTADTLVCSYSTPVFALKQSETLNGRGVTNWLQMAEKDLIKDCGKYNNLTVTDIKSFYPSIYTHSISWAIHGRTFMKTGRNRYDYDLLGNRLDKLLQDARDGQTNGIPVGSMVSDIISEIILMDIDQKLSKKIRDEKLTDSVLIARYRDDYRIVSKTIDEGRRVLGYLNSILNIEYDLQLNSDKTNSYTDIIEGSFRPWSLEIKNSHLLRKVYYGDLSECTNANHLKDCLLETYRIQKKFPDHRAAVGILAKLLEGLYKNPTKINLHAKSIPEIIAILRKLTLLREDVTPEVFLLLDILLTRINKKSEKKLILKAIMDAVSGKSDQGYQLIWFYRLCLSHLAAMCAPLLGRNKGPLLRIISRTYYTHDYEVFPPTKFSSADKLELEKFSLIDRKKLGAAKGKGINPTSISPFRY